MAGPELTNTRSCRRLVGPEPTDKRVPFSPTKPLRKAANSPRLDELQPHDRTLHGSRGLPESGQAQLTGLALTRKVIRLL
jgi:hypothetical protein